MTRTYFVYILASPARRLRVGMTADLRGRLRRYASSPPGRSRGLRLVFFEVCTGLPEAMARRDQISGMGRSDLIALVEDHNAGWLDLVKPWFSTDVLPLSRTLTR